MKTILVPTDFSKLSITSIYYAIGLAKEINAKIIVLNVINGVLSTSSLNTWKNLDEQMIQDAQTEATRLLEEISNKHGIIDISYSYVLGFPVKDAVEEFATQHKVDFIVMGSKGVTGLSKAFLGTNAAAVINNSSIPVFIIPGEVNYKRIKNIVYASDMDNLLHEMKAITKFAALVDASVHVLHVVDTEEGLSKEKTKLRDGLIEELIRMTNYSDIHLHLKRNSDIAEGVEKFVVETRPDLLIMFTHRLDFYEKLFGKSITRQVVFHNDTPLLAFNKTNQ